MLQIAVNDCNASRITPVQLISVFQEAIDNGDILEEANEFCVVAHVLPLIDSCALRSSEHVVAFEARMGAKATAFARESRQWERRRRVTTALRWVAVLPSAILGCIVARIAIVLINRITMAGYVDPNSLLARVFVEWISSVIMGVAVVYFGWYVAPAFKLHTAIILAGIILLVSGAMLFAALVQRDYWAIFATLAMNLGSIGTAYFIAVLRFKLRADEGRIPD